MSPFIGHHLVQNVCRDGKGHGHVFRKTPFGESGWRIMKASSGLQHLAAQVSGAAFQVLRCLLDASSETGHSNERRGCQIYTFHTTQSFLEV